MRTGRACEGMAVLQDFKVAALFLTRFPVRVDGQVSMRDLASAVYAFPVMGAAVGLLGGLGFAAAGWLGLPGLAAALLALLCMILATGALHEDGLADTADALGAGTDRVRALAIMSDSRIGSFGTVALVLSILARLIALAPMWDTRLVTSVLVAAGMTSRAVLPVVMLLQPSAKATGLAAEAGRPEPLRAMLAAFIAIGTTVILLPYQLAVSALLVSALLSLLLAAWLGRRFGGCTGDTLGAVQQVAEIAFLFAVIAHL